MSVGTVTTGDPGTQAAVTNSGTENNAVLDFTIPQGAAGTNPPVQLLSAYSIPAQAGTASTPLVFDRTGVSYGTAAEHTANSPDFTITQPGVYTLAFSGSFAPGNGAAFPLNVGITAQLGGTDIPGASAQHTFQSASDVASLSFTVPFAVTAAPRHPAGGGRRHYVPLQRPFRHHHPERGHPHHLRPFLPGAGCGPPLHTRKGAHLWSPSACA